MKIPSKDVIQADSPDRVMATVDAVARGAKDDSGIADAIGELNARQGRYYRRAAEVLGFITRDASHQSLVTPLGKQFADADELGKNALFTQAVLSNPLFQQLVSFLGEKGTSGASRNEIERFLSDVADLGAASMAPRRASSYLKWLLKLENVKQDRNLWVLSSHVQLNSMNETRMPQEEYRGENQIHRYSVSLVTQGRHRFYTLTMPSDVLANTCFVTTREEDPREGFQRVLDKGRAEQIAEYIDSGLGTIPNSIVLSAQVDAEFKVVGKGKTVEFKSAKKAFLVLDGQHRIFGFSLANKRLRVPVVIYNNLSKRDESRLFIDINTKQRPVPNELLLDIKKLAEYETDAEKLFGEVFDLFVNDPSSPLFGLMSPSSRASGKISRVTFNAAFKPLFSTFEKNDAQEVYNALQAYIRAFIEGCSRLNAKETVRNPTVFRAMIQFFPEVGDRVKNRFRSYTVDNFSAVLSPVFEKLKPAELLRPARSYVELLEAFSKSLKQNFTL